MPMRLIIPIGEYIRDSRRRPSSWDMFPISFMLLPGISDFLTESNEDAVDGEDEGKKRTHIS